MINCATELVEAGVHFKKKDVDKSEVINYFLKVSLAGGLLEIPFLKVESSTSSKLRNLIALEQCCPHVGSYFTSNAILMDNIINTEGDVAILRGSNIIEGGRSNAGEGGEEDGLYTVPSTGDYRREPFPPVTLRRGGSITAAEAFNPLFLGSRRIGLSHSERNVFLVAFWLRRRRPLCRVLVVGELPLSLLQWFGHGDASVLVAECGSGMERGGGGQSDVKGPNRRLPVVVPLRVWFGSCRLVGPWDGPISRFGLLTDIATGWLLRYQSEGDVYLVAFWALPSEGERDGSIRRVHHLKATPSASPSGRDQLSVALLMLNATGQYVAFRSEGDTHGCRDLVAIAMSFACCGCPACSLFARCLALEGLSIVEVSPLPGPPIPVHLFEGALRVAGELELKL
ncbi:hypothetical protein Taro_032732 [Colocasia esculenta]|uniref:Uncharacterized protein n=1 Tax=Colocasia esculenta TaxID=4460 RepID=A0A843VM20_COLES|nr:hypothetical protein [Colocasia esculenta]